MDTKKNWENMRCSSRLCLIILTCLVSHHVGAQGTAFPIVTKAAKVSIVYDEAAPKLDSIAAHLLAEDIERVTSFKPTVLTDITKVTGNIIVIGAVQSPLVQKVAGKASFFNRLRRKWECFALTVVEKPLPAVPKAFVIAGSDARGTAYGVFTVSERLGVSPWWWWADVPVKKQRELTITQPDFISSPPTIKYRGIFINDEDWGLQPWAAKTFEPETGDVGPKTYAKIFELLLRLKANLVWPAMHPSTKAFFYYTGNVKTAEDYQIVVGSSHAEPMLRNNVGEWDEKTMGPFNYLTNKDEILRYWEDRVKKSKGINAVYSLGIRGVHDSQMEGVKNLKEAVPVMEDAIKAQRELLSQYINPNLTAVPQVLTPYKEVLEVYDNGLKVPEDVTLVWPDDNYGYIQRLSNEEEQKRPGGSGVYYHASYWGRPHDYLWLSSTHPSLIREEMMKAYATGADRLWVLNVGDIKPLEYNMQLFLDMAYNATPFKESSYTQKHLLQWNKKVFGKNAALITDVLWSYYDLAFERRPEFMGWSRTEPITNTTYTSYNHFCYGDEAQRRIDKYEALEKVVEGLRRKTDSSAFAAFYELVYYPVVGASQMNKKFLYRDKAYLYAKQNRISAYTYATRSEGAYHRIEKETDYYNTSLLNGKWQAVMSMKPRDLPVYQSPALPSISITKQNRWSIAPEGFDTTLVNSFVLPAFTEGRKQSYFIDVFLCDSTTVQWKATPSANWITLSAQNGSLFPEQNKNETRLWVRVDWAKALNSVKVNGYIDFTGSGKHYRVRIQASRPPVSALKNFKGFVETDGLVSMFAQHYTGLTNKAGFQWQTVNGLGHTGASVMTAVTPLATKPLDTTTIKQSASRLSYDFFTFSDVAPQVIIYALPSLPLNKHHRVRCAFSIDEGPLQTVDFRANSIARSEEWKQNVLRNEAVYRIAYPLLEQGKHTLKIFAVDPGVIVDRILIDLGGLKPAYGVIDETK